MVASTILGRDLLSELGLLQKSESPTYSIPGTHLSAMTQQLAALSAKAESALRGTSAVPQKEVKGANSSLGGSGSLPSDRVWESSVVLQGDRTEVGCPLPAPCTGTCDWQDGERTQIPLLPSPEGFWGSFSSATIPLAVALPF
jgi:hypothetical protein